MALTIEEFLQAFNRDQLYHIATNYELDCNSRSTKDELIKAIQQTFQKQALVEDSIIDILDMFYKYQLKPVCRRLGGEGLSSLNTEELYDYIISLCLADYPDEDLDVEEDDVEEDLIDKDPGTIFSILMSFLEPFKKDDLLHIADQLDLEISTSIKKDDLLDLILSEYSIDYPLEEQMENILEMFYKYELKNRFSKIFNFSLSNVTYQDLKSYIINHYIGEYDYFETEEEDEDGSESSVISRIQLAQDYEHSSLPVWVLIAGAQPFNEDPIKLRTEIKKIKSVIQVDPTLKVVPRCSTTKSDLIEALSDYNPIILHLSAHGDKDGSIAFEDERGKSSNIKKKNVARIIAAHNNDRKTTVPLKGIILSNCFSEIGAKELTNSVDFVIAMSTSVEIDAAIQFTEGFYSGIREGYSIDAAFNMGIATINETSEQMIFKLLPKDRDFSNLRLVV